MLHLAVDSIGIKCSGTATVLQDFLAAAIADPRLSRITLFCSPRSTRDFDIPRSGKIVEVEEPLAEKSYVYRLWWYQRRLALKVREIGAHGLFCMNGAGVGPASVSQVTFIQQSLPYYPEAQRQFDLRGRLKISMIRLMHRQACRAGSAILVQTPTMSREISSAFKIPTERIHAILPSASPLRRGQQPSERLSQMRATPSGARLLYVDNRWPYKNLQVAIEAMRSIRASMADATLFVTWPQDDQRLTGQDHVVGLGYLRDGALREAYEMATALIMPSLSETVGLPMLEAMSVGTPVLAADRPYAHDVCEDAAIFFDPKSSENLAEKAINLLSNRSLLAEMSKKGAALIRKRTGANPYHRMVDVIIKNLNRLANETALGLQGDEISLGAQ